MSEWSQTWTFTDDAANGATKGGWVEGNPPLVGAREHTFWLASSVFDGARAFEGVTPDLDLHCARLNRSATALGLKPTKTPEEVYALCREGVTKFDDDAALYIRPMYYGTQGGYTGVAVDPESTRFCISIYVTPMPEPTGGTTITLSPFRRPTRECMPLDAKAGCLYPNNGRAIVEAQSRGFHNALMCDMLGNVAELATANVFTVRDGVVMTPASNGTFLSGITRRRTILNLREAGYEVVETALQPQHFMDADEIFSTGNYSKVMPITRFEERDLQPGPVAARARELYWEFAHAA